MARLADIPVVLREVGLRPFARRVWNEVLDDHLLVFAGSLAYAWLFAIFPFFIFLINLIPFLPLDDKTVAVGELEVFLKALLPDLAAQTLHESMHGAIDNAIAHRRGGVLSASLLVALWGASGGIGVTMAALDKCYEIDRPRAFYKRRPMAFGLTAAAAALIAVVALLLPAGAAFRDWVVQYRMPTVSAWAIGAFDLLRGSLAIAAALAFVSLLYHFGPSVKRRYRFVTPGSAFTLVCWVVIGLAFREYIARFGQNYHKTYGPVGGVAVLLLLFYLDALILLIGAEIDSEIDYAVLKVDRGSTNFRAAEPPREPRRRRRRKRGSGTPSHAGAEPGPS
jgi:membrane protein